MKENIGKEIASKKDKEMDKTELKKELQSIIRQTQSQEDDIDKKEHELVELDSEINKQKRKIQEINEEIAELEKLYKELENED
jgi:polyhydroxyalkanoate synthesis regulator phasin